MLIGKIEKYRRLFTYLISAVIPLLTFWVLVYFGYDPTTSTMYAFATSVISLFLCNIVSINALTKIREDGKLLVMTFDSRGSLFLYNAEIKQNEPIIKIENTNKDFYYSRNVLQRLVFAITPKFAEAEREESNNLKITIPKQDVYDAKFMFEGVQTILYNRNIDNIITKDFLRQKEEGMFLENQLNVTNIELDKLLHLTENYTQTFIQKFFNKNNQQNLLIILIILIVLAVAFFFVKPAVEPALANAGNIIQPIQQATAPVQPIG